MVIQLTVDEINHTNREKNHNTHRVSRARRTTYQSDGKRKKTIEIYVKRPLGKQTKS